MARKKVDHVDNLEEDDTAEPAPEVAEGKQGVYTVTVDPSLVPMLKLVAAALKTNGKAYVNNRLSQWLQADLAEAMDALGFQPKPTK